MFLEHNYILDAYHRAVGRHEKKTGEQYPIVRSSCVFEDGTITTTSVVDPQVIATWRYDSAGRIRIKFI